MCWPNSNKIVGIQTLHQQKRNNWVLDEASELVKQRTQSVRGNVNFESLNTRRYRRQRQWYGPQAIRRKTTRMRNRRRRRGGRRRGRGGRGARWRRRRTRGGAVTVWRRRGWPGGADTAGSRARPQATPRRRTGLVRAGLELCSLDGGLSGERKRVSGSRVLVPA